MKKSEIFTRAYKAIQEDHEFICCAIHFVDLPANANAEAYLNRCECMDIVQSRITRDIGNTENDDNPGTTLDCWMAAKHPELAKLQFKDNELYEKMMQKTRLAWLKSLIKEFRAKGE